MTHYLANSFDKKVALHYITIASTFPWVKCSEPLVETTVIEAAQGVVIPLINWKGKDGLGVPIKNLRVQVYPSVPMGKVSLASGRPVRVQIQDKLRIFTLDLDVADALILRK